MSTKKLYALSEREAAVLRARDPRWTDSAQRATPDPLTPIHMDAAVERMARALAESLYGGDFWDDYEDDGITLAVNRESFRSDARAALGALLQEDA